MLFSYINEITILHARKKCESHLLINVPDFVNLFSNGITFNIKHLDPIPYQFILGGKTEELS